MLVLLFTLIVTFVQHWHGFKSIILPLIRVDANARNVRTSMCHKMPVKLQAESSCKMKMNAKAEGKNSSVYACRTVQAGRRVQQRFNILEEAVSNPGGVGSETPELFSFSCLGVDVVIGAPRHKVLDFLSVAREETSCDVLLMKLHTVVGKEGVEEGT